FPYYRFRKGDAKPPATLPDARLLEYADHPTARGRAALLHLGRVVKDPALVPVAERLARDPEFEVRRAAAMALAEGPKDHERPPETRKRCLAALKELANDVEPKVVASACRALTSYEAPGASGL